LTDFIEKQSENNKNNQNLNGSSKYTFLKSNPQQAAYEDQLS